MKVESMNILFLCSMNQWRSPTAEKIYNKHAFVKTRSAGTSPKARRHVCRDDIQWAEIIIVMENTHKKRLLAKFPEASKFEP